MTYTYYTYFNNKENLDDMITLEGSNDDTPNFDVYFFPEVILISAELNDDTIFNYIELEEPLEYDRVQEITSMDVYYKDVVNWIQECEAYYRGEAERPTDVTTMEDYLLRLAYAKYMEFLAVRDKLFDIVDKETLIEDFDYMVDTYNVVDST